MSSPLILGFDMANDTEYDRWFPFLSNPRALHIQSTWAGSAGRLVRAGPTFTTRVPHGTTCEDMKDTHDLPEWTIWSKPLTNLEDGGTAAVVAALVLNTRQDLPANVTVALHDLGVSEGGRTVKETEVWSGDVAILTRTDLHVSLPPGGHRWVILEVA